MKAVGVSIEKLEFVQGSSFQTTSPYALDLLKLTTVVTDHGKSYMCGIILPLLIWPFKDKYYTPHLS